jgi:phosphoserine phosphatase
MNLVFQSPFIEKTHLAELATRTRPSRIAEIGDRAYRLSVETRTDISSWCEERRIDHAWIEEGRRFADLRLLAMDMDSTLITIECIDELGAYAGKKAEIAAITEAAMRGEIRDYKESLRRRVSLLAGQPASILDDLYEKKVALTPGAERLVASCKKSGVELLLVSGGFSAVTDRLKARLGLDHVLSNTLAVEKGRLTGELVGDIVDADAKAGMFLKTCRRLGASSGQTVAIGDGANDLKMMAEAGLSVAFRAKPVVAAQADCQLRWCGLDAVVNFFE